MAAPSDKLRLLTLVEEIRTAIESNDANNAATRPRLLMKITDLRDAVEAPQDSLLRIYSQVSHDLKPRWLFTWGTLINQQQPLQNAALRVAVELGLPEIISTASSPNHETGTSLAQLASRSHGDPKLIGRHALPRFTSIVCFRSL